MPTLVRARARLGGAVLALGLATTACGSLDGGAGTRLASPLAPGEPAGTVTVAAGGDPGQLVQRVQEAITANGGTVAAVIDHAATAGQAGVQIPPNTVVLGGPDAAGLALLTVEQQAAVVLPPPYQVRVGAGGDTLLTHDSADYLAAVGEVSEPGARAPLLAAANAVVAGVAPGAAVTRPAPLIGVTPVDYLLTVFGSRDVPATVGLLQRAAGRGGNRFVAAIDLARAPATIRPTSVVLVGRPAAEAPLLATAPTIGLDLPMRFLVWIDDQQRTLIGYPDIRRIAVRHGIPADDPNVVALAAEADKLSRIGAGIDQ